MEFVPAAVRLSFAKQLWKWSAHPSQRRWMLDDGDKVAACGRRWGKTESAIIDDLTSAILMDGFKAMVVAPTRDQVMLLYEPTKKLCEETPEIAGTFKCKESPHPEIRIGDSRIYYRTSGDDGKNIRGYGLNRIRVDEAAYVKEGVITDVIEPMLMDFAGQLILQGTPFGKNWFYKRFQSGQKDDPDFDGSLHSYHFPSLSNPHVSHKYLGKMRAKYGRESVHWRCEYEAEFVDSASAVFPWEHIQNALYDPAEIQWGNIEKYGGGIDLGKAQDYTVVMIGGHLGGMLYVKDMDRFSGVPWPETKKRVYDMAHKYNASCVIDATGVGDPVADDLMAGEYYDGGDGRIRKREGIMLETVKFTNQVKDDLTRHLAVRLANGMVKIPTTFSDLIDELKFFGYEMTDSGKVRYAGIGTEHDDTVIALELLSSQSWGQHEKQESEGVYPPGTLGALLAEIEEEENRKVNPVIGQTRHGWEGELW
jgi:hypothetical protein